MNRDNDNNGSKGVTESRLTFLEPFQFSPARKILHKEVFPCGTIRENVPSFLYLKITTFFEVSPTKSEGGGSSKCPNRIMDIISGRIKT